MYWVIGTAIGVGVIATLIKEHLNAGGKITIGGLIFIMLLIIGWEAQIDKQVSCDNGNQTACEQIERAHDDN
jgi:hypothetical protein